MNIPLNVDWQQILLHWMNLAILTGGLYFLLYKPVKQFMEKREAYYRDLEDQAAGKLREAEELKAAYQAKLDGAEEEIHLARAKAKEEAASSREQIIRESQRELRELTVAAVKKLTVKADTDLFDQFLDLAEGGKPHEEQ